MGLFERWLGLKPRESASVTPRRVEIPQAMKEREEMFAEYLAALERVEAEERGVKLDDAALVSFDVQLQPEDRRKMEELRQDQELRAAVKAYQEDQKRQMSQRRVA